MSVPIDREHAATIWIDGVVYGDAPGLLPDMDGAWCEWGYEGGIVLCLVDTHGPTSVGVSCHVSIGTGI